MSGAKIHISKDFFERRKQHASEADYSSVENGQDE